MPASFRLRLLGLPTTADDQPILLPHKARVLLARLLLSPNPLRRATILPLLWPSATEAHARGSLRVTLHTIRQMLGPDTLRTDRELVALDRIPPTDLRAFVDAIRRGDDAEAVQLYRGPLLADVALYDSLDGDLWLESERRQLARRFEAAARRVLTSTATTALSAASRLTLAQRLRDSDPEQVSSWATLLDIVSRVGTPEQLLQERTALEARVVNRELADMRVAEALLRSHRSLASPSRRARPTALAAVDDDRSLASRGAALNALETDWTRVTLGTSSCLFVTGQAGIGKSVLLESLQHRLSTSAATVIAVRADRSARDLSFTLLRDVVRRLIEQPGALQLAAGSARALAALDGALAERLGVGNPPAPPHDTPESVTTLVRAVRDLLRQVSAEAPSALLLDDLHWADRVSRRVLRRAAVAVSETPLLVIATARVPLGQAWLGWPRLHLLPLPTPDARVLVDHLAPSLPAATIAGLVERAGGVPLRLLHGARLAEELAEASPTALANVSRALHNETTWQEGPVATRVRLLMATTPDSIPLLAMLALWDAPVPTVELASADLRIGSTAPYDPLRARLTALRDLVTPAPGDTWRLTHDRIADAVLRVASPQSLHDAATHLVRRFAGRAVSPRDRHQLERLAGGYATLGTSHAERAAAHASRGEPAIAAEADDLFPTRWVNTGSPIDARTATRERASLADFVKHR